MQPLLKQKLGLLNQLLNLSMRQMLVVHIEEEVADLLNSKDDILRQISVIDEQLPQLTEADAEYSSQAQTLIEAIIENEDSMEKRLNDVKNHLHNELRLLEKQSSVKAYLLAGRKG